MKRNCLTDTNQAAHIYLEATTAVMDTEMTIGLQQHDLLSSFLFALSFYLPAYTDHLLKLAHTTASKLCECLILRLTFSSRIFD